MRIVETFGDGALGIFTVGDFLLVRQFGLPGEAANGIDGAVAPTMISQAAGSRGGPFCGQVFNARRHAS